MKHKIHYIPKRGRLRPEDWRAVELSIRKSMGATRDRKGEVDLWSGAYAAAKAVVRTLRRRGFLIVVGKAKP